MRVGRTAFVASKQELLFVAQRLRRDLGNIADRATHARVVDRHLNDIARLR
jgi:hypothetical protein